jgi:hypothetical protein
MMAEHTTEEINREVPFHGSVTRVFSTIVVADPNPGVRANTSTSATPPASDQTLTEAHGEDREFLAHLKHYHGWRFSDEW